MKPISNEDFDNLPTQGRGRASNVFTWILNLKPGENILIEKKDWQRKRKLTTIASYIGKRYQRKFKTKTMPDGSGWAVRRTE